MDAFALEPPGSCNRKKSKLENQKIDFKGCSYNKCRQTEKGHGTKRLKLEESERKSEERVKKE